MNQSKCLLLMSIKFLFSYSIFMLWSDRVMYYVYSRIVNL